MEAVRASETVIIYDAVNMDTSTRMFSMSGAAGFSGRRGNRKYFCKLAFKQFQSIFTDHLGILRIEIFLFFLCLLIFSMF